MLMSRPSPFVSSLGRGAGERARRSQRRPQIPDQLARHSDNDLGRVFSAMLHAAISPAQPLLCLIGERDDGGRLVVTPLGECDPDAWLVTVVPGRLDQQTAHVAVTGARGAAALLAGGTAVLAWDPPEGGPQLGGGAGAPGGGEVGQE